MRLRPGLRPDPTGGAYCVPQTSFLVYGEEWMGTVEDYIRTENFFGGMEQKGLKVNMEKTKVMNCKVRQGQAENSGKFPCGICKKGVGRNSICCTNCKKWINKKCSGIRSRLESVVGFQCTNCSQGLVAESLS